MTAKTTTHTFLVAVVVLALALVGLPQAAICEESPVDISLSINPYMSVTLGTDSLHLLTVTGSDIEDGLNGIATGNSLSTYATVITNVPGYLIVPKQVVLYRQPDLGANQTVTANIDVPGPVPSSHGKYYLSVAPGYYPSGYLVKVQISKEWTPVDAPGHYKGTLVVEVSTAIP